MAYHDELTGLPGRRALNEALLRVGSRYAVAMVDVDHFKHFNDAYGHEVGDQVLRMVAAQLDRGGGGGFSLHRGAPEDDRGHAVRAAGTGAPPEEAGDGEASARLPEGGIRDRQHRPGRARWTEDQRAAGDRGGRQSAVPRQGFRSKPSDGMIRDNTLTVVERRNAWISG